MIDLPGADVIAKIVEQTDLSASDVQERIKEKLTQLSGLISEDGAAHIVANDLGVTLYKTQGSIKIKELSTAAKNTSFAGKVVQKYEMREFNTNGRQGKVANLLLADETGTIRIVMWNDQVNLFETLKEQDILQITNPYVKENNGRMEVHLNDRSEIKVNPEGVTISTPAGNFASAPAAQAEREMKYLKDITGEENEVEVLATIVQVYDPRYFDVCPTCNKRLRDDNSCNEHGAVTPMTNYVTTVFLDDGTANLRATFWKKETQELFKKSDTEVLAWKESPNQAQDAKTELLGEIVKVVCRAKKNEQFGKIELTAMQVFTDVDPAVELEKLKAKDSGAEKETPSATAEQPVASTPQASTQTSATSAAQTSTSTAAVASAAAVTAANVDAAPSPDDEISEESTVHVDPAVQESEDTPADQSDTSASPASEAENTPSEDDDDEAEAPEPASTTQIDREVKPEDVQFQSGTQIKEEVVSIDDLEDL